MINDNWEVENNTRLLTGSTTRDTATTLITRLRSLGRVAAAVLAVSGSVAGPQGQVVS